ncbi:holo-ACP synthase [Buchnera aphidicola]|uniref:holo-ACP synthase n=1 Tax=Buchnera aphidicola TaxID=9 RepID=UPI0034648DB9
MSIIGIGIDIIKISRIKKIFNKFHVKFAKKILSKIEWLNFRHHHHKINFLAKIFSIKEAVLKALGTGWNNKINFKNILLIHNKSGKPKIKFINVKHYKYFITNIKKIHVSTTDEKEYIVSMVIIE